MLCCRKKTRQSQKALLHYLRHEELVFVNSYQLGLQHYSYNKRYNMNYTVVFSLQHLIPSGFWVAGEKKTKASLLPGFHLPFAHLHMVWRIIICFQILAVLPSRLQQQHWTQPTSQSLNERVNVNVFIYKLFS